MKLSAYKDLESSKRAQTLSRIILIAGAHLVIIGGTFLVTNFGSKQEGETASIAGVGTWSSQGASASEASVDASSSSLFDSRASNLDGYNAGDAKPVLLASNAAPSSSGAGARFAPRRPSSTSSLNNDVTPNTSRPVSNDDDFLQPIGRPSTELYPVHTPIYSSESVSETFEYKVQNGDSLWGITQRFKVSREDLAAVNPGLTVNIRAGQVLQVPRSSDLGAASAPPMVSSTTVAKPAPANGTIYTVRAGDVLSRIASRQGLTVAELKAANGLSNDVIRIGQELVIPTKTSSAVLVSKQHRGPKVTIEPGDTLGKYAAIYGVSAEELMKLNNITNPRLIRIGQTLLIPEKASSRTSAPQIVQPTVSQPTRSQPSRTTTARPVETLPTLEDLPPPSQSLSTLPTLDETFGAEDLEDQPLIQISE